LQYRNPQVFYGQLVMQENIALNLESLKRSTLYWLCQETWVFTKFGTNLYL